MKDTKMAKWMVRGAKLLASFAFLLATVSAAGTCLFASYQPEVPEELL